MNDLKQIDRIVAKYNKLEDDQRDLLERLYNLVDRRYGHRRVVFGSYSWINCWRQERHDLAIAKHVDGLVRKITKVEPGAESGPN